MLSIRSDTAKNRNGLPAKFPITSSMIDLSLALCLIPASAKHKDLAWEWIKMYTSLEKQEEFYKNNGILSPRKEFWEKDGIKGSYMDTVREALDSANMWWRIAASTEVDSSLNTNVSAYLSGQEDMDSAIGKMKEDIEAALAAAPPEEGSKNYNR